MCTHLEARHTSVTSRRREDLLVVSPINDETNELRAKIEKLAARNIEAAQSTTTSPFNTETQQAPLPAGFRMPIMATREILTLKIIWKPLMTGWTYFRSPLLLAAGVL